MASIRQEAGLLALCLRGENFLRTGTCVLDTEIFLSLLVVCLFFVVLYLVVRAAVAGGIRDARSHDKRRAAPDQRRSSI